MNILLHEIRQYSVSAIIWILSLTSIVGLFILMYPTFTANSDMYSVIENLPEVVRRLFGFSNEFSTFPSFFVISLQLATLGAAIQALTISIGVVSKEIQGKTAEFIYTKPITRTRILLEKLVATVIIVLLTQFLIKTGKFMQAAGQMIRRRVFYSVTNFFKEKLK